MRGHLHPLRKRHLSVRNPERKNAKQILKICSVLLSRDRSVLSWWHEEKKMEAATHSTSHSLRSARLSVCLSSASFSLSLSLSLSPSLSPLQILSAHLFFPPRILCLDPSSAPQLDREPWEFSPTWRTKKKKKNSSAAVGAHQAWRYRKELLLLQECDECLYLPTRRGFTYCKVCPVFSGDSCVKEKKKEKLPLRIFWVRMTVKDGAVWTHDKHFFMYSPTGAFFFLLLYLHFLM